MTTKNDAWYDIVDADEPLTQADIIEDCPLLVWDEDVSGADDLSISGLQAKRSAKAGDVIVMTQACDLEHDKVNAVILCPCDLLTKMRSDMEATFLRRNETLTKKAIGKICEKAIRGEFPNLCMLNHSGTAEHPKDDHRVVDFQEVYTLPRSFLSRIVRSRGRQRLRLKSPYREHVSQAFARFFMRVGLPVAVNSLQ